MLPRTKVSLSYGSKLIINTCFNITNSIKHNPFLSMSIEKLIKLASSKPCNSHNDIQLCMFIFDSFGKSKVQGDAIKQQMNEQACRITRNISKFIDQMDPKELIQITQLILDGIEKRKFEVESKILAQYTSKLGEYLIKITKEDVNGQNVRAVSDICKNLIKLRKSLLHVRDIIPYIVKFSNDYEEIFALLSAFDASKSKTTMILSMLFKTFLETCFAKLENGAQIPDKLIDQFVFRLYIDYKFHIKKPYMGVDRWMAIYLQKLKHKYISQAQNLNYFKKINFLKSYTRLMIELPMGYDISVEFGDLQFISSYMKHLKQESMAMEDPLINYDKVRQFISMVEIYISFMEKFSTFQELTHRQLFQQFIGNIHQAFFKYTDLSKLSLEQEQKFLLALTRLIRHYWICLRGTYGQKTKESVKQKQTIALLETCDHIFANLLKKNQMNPPNFHKIFQILNHTTILISQLKNTFGTPKQKILKISKKSVGFLEQLAKQKNSPMFVFFSLERDFDRTSNGIVSTYFFFKIIDHQIPVQLKQRFDNMGEKNLAVIIDTLSRCICFDFDVVMDEIDGINKKILQKCEKYFENDKVPTGITEYEIVSNFLGILSSTNAYNKKIIPIMHDFWFNKNKQFVENLWSSEKSVMYEIAWNALNISHQFFYTSINRYGLDVFFQVTRICFDKSPVLMDSTSHEKTSYLRKVNRVFSERLVQNTLFKKADHISEYKYSWFFVFLKLVNLYVATPKFSQRSKLKSPNNNSKENQDQSWASQPSMSVHKLVEYMFFVITDFKKPLQAGSFRSQYISSIIQKSMQQIVQILQNSLTLSGNSILQNRQLQYFFKNPPIDSILYWLSEHNQLQNNTWQHSINLYFFKYSLYKKYEPLSILNLILMLDLTIFTNKKVHDHFIKNQIQKNQSVWSAKTQKQQNALPKLLQSSTVVKVFYLVIRKASSKNQNLPSLDLLRSPNAFTNEEIVDIWTKKKILQKVTEKEILQILVQKLLNIPFQFITYPQYSTIVNTVLSLPLVQAKKLTNWVCQAFQFFTQKNRLNYLLDYFAIRKNFRSITVYEQNMPELVKESFQNNTIDLIEHLYEIGYSNIQKDVFIDFLKCCKKRGLLNTYYDVEENQIFQASILLDMLYGLILYQQDISLLLWFRQNWLNCFNFKNISNFLNDVKKCDIEEKNRFLKNLVLRQMISQLMIRQSQNKNIEIGELDLFFDECELNLGMIKKKIDENMTKQHLLQNQIQIGKKRKYVEAEQTLEKIYFNLKINQ